MRVARFGRSFAGALVAGCALLAAVASPADATTAARAAAAPAVTAKPSTDLDLDFSVVEVDVGSGIIFNRGKVEARNVTVSVTATAGRLQLNGKPVGVTVKKVRRRFISFVIPSIPAGGRAYIGGFFIFGNYDKLIGHTVTVRVHASTPDPNLKNNHVTYRFPPPHPV
jgi:hypothetical protein